VEACQIEYAATDQHRRRHDMKPPHHKEGDVNDPHGVSGAILNKNKQPGHLSSAAILPQVDQP
jgi:hypothetical protein